MLATLQTPRRRVTRCLLVLVAFVDVAHLADGVALLTKQQATTNTPGDASAVTLTQRSSGLDERRHMGKIALQMPAEQNKTKKEDTCFLHGVVGDALRMRSSTVEAASRLQSWMGKRFSTCAVVGSGESMQGRGFGTAIDQHEAVIRMNSHPTKGFEDDVGGKTTFRFLYPESSNILWDSNEVANHVVLVPFKSADEVWLDCMLARQNPCHCVMARTGTLKNPFWKLSGCQKDDHDLNSAFVLSPRMRAVEESCTNVAHLRKRPSIGFTTTIFAISVCDAVDVYGMVGDERYHNQDDIKAPDYYSPSASHDFVNEHALYQRLEAADQLRRPDT